MGEQDDEPKSTRVYTGRNSTLSISAGNQSDGQAANFEPLIWHELPDIINPVTFSIEIAQARTASGCKPGYAYRAEDTVTGENFYGVADENGDVVFGISDA